MKKYLNIAMVALVTCFAACSASALLIDANDLSAWTLIDAYDVDNLLGTDGDHDGDYYTFGNPANQDFGDSAFDHSPDLGDDWTSESLYKEDVGDGFDSGSFASSYETVFSNTAEDPSSATISYISGMDAIMGGDGWPIWLEVKDGKQDPATYLFDISSWNGTDQIVLENFWTGNGAISHVEIHGHKVPDGGATIALLGLACIGLRGLRRKFGE